VSAATYRAVLAVPGLARLVGGSQLARVGQAMGSVVLILFVLAHYGSAGLAGLAVFLSVFPGLMVSPVAGALLDRRGRVLLITLDYAIAGVGIGSLGLLSLAGALPAGLLLAICAVSSLTTALSNTGTRSLFPVLVPRELWDRANAIDSSGYVVALVIGPALGGVLVAAAGGQWALIGTGLVYALAALVVAGVRDLPASAARRAGGLLEDARLGVLYVMRSPSLRGLAIALSVSNLGFGIFIVALPLRVLDHLGGGPGEVGALWAMSGVGGVAGALWAGRYDSEGRERLFLGGGMLVAAMGLVLVLLASNVAVAGVGMALIGAGNGPVDIGLFSLRQRRTDKRWVGRAFAVSMSLNYCGMPIGSAIGGQLAGRSVTAALVVAIAIVVGSSVLPGLIIPAAEEVAEAPLPSRARAVR